MSSVSGRIRTVSFIKVSDNATVQQIAMCNARAAAPIFLLLLVWLCGCKKEQQAQSGTSAMQAALLADMHRGSSKSAKANAADMHRHTAHSPSKKQVRQHVSDTTDAMNLGFELPLIQ